MIAPPGLARAWMALIVASIVSTGLALLPVPAGWSAAIGIAILVVAWIKARIVLARYMGLETVPAWQHGFDLCLGAFTLLLISLFLAPVLL